MFWDAVRCEQADPLSGLVTWKDALKTAFPMRVAPKKVPKGTRKWPQATPARSKSGFGIDAHRRMPKKPYFIIRS